MKTSAEKEHAKKILTAARKGHVELPPEEQFLVDSGVNTTKKKKKTWELNDKLASQGFSLVEQVRSEKPVDLMKRNLKYLKYTDSRPLDSKKADTMLKFHINRLQNKEIVRKHRETLTGLREPKKITKKKNRSVFSDKDFKNLTGKKLKKVQDSDGRFV